MVRHIYCIRSSWWWWRDDDNDDGDNDDDDDDDYTVREKLLKAVITQLPIILCNSLDINKYYSNGYHNTLIYKTFW